MCYMLNAMKRRYLTCLLPGALMALSLAAPAAGAEEVFRWVDKDGVVHYGDSPPPEYAEQMFDSRFPAVDPDQEADRKKAQADRVLLQTYLSVAEIEAVRDDRLEQLQYRDRLTRSYLDNLNRHLGDLETAAGVDAAADTATDSATDATTDAAGDPASAPDSAPAGDAADETGQDAALVAEIEETRRKIEIYQAELADSEAQQAELRAKFDGDIARFRQLTAAAQENG